MMWALHIIFFCIFSYASALDIFIDSRVLLLDCKSHGSEEQVENTTKFNSTDEPEESTTKFHTTAETVDPKELFDAARDGDLSFVNAAITGQSNNSLILNWRNPDHDGYTALHIATRHPSIVAALLDAGADPNRQSDDGQTPVYLAAGSGRTGALELMLAHGGDPNKVTFDDGGSPDPNQLTSFGTSPLMTASYHGQVEAARMLIQAGAHMDYYRPYDGHRALHEAAIGSGHSNHKDILLLLLQNGAKNYQDNSGRTAADDAREWLPHPSIVGMPDEFGDESVAQLIEDY